MLDYQDIKQLAGDLGCSVKDLIALSYDNDPFYAGVPSREKWAQWFAGQWEIFGFQSGVHVRRVHYRLITADTPILKPNGEPYQNTENDWKALGTASLAARYLGLVPASSFIDRRAPAPILKAPDRHRYEPSTYVWGDWPRFGDLDEELSPPHLSAQGIDVVQDYIVELWCEKSTQNDILVPLAAKLGLNLVTGVGEMSETFARHAVERAIDFRKPVRILYISDFDPAGRSMPVAAARKIEFTLASAGLDLDITLEPIALLPEQCEQYRLPRVPIKEKERRAGKFEERFGAGATELDALESLHEGTLREIVEREVFRYLDPTLEGRVNNAKFKIDLQIIRARQDILDQHRDELQDAQGQYDVLRNQIRELEEQCETLWGRISDDLREAAPEIPSGYTPLPRPADPVEEPLFDSKRDYLSQLDAYRHWQGKGL